MIFSKQKNRIYFLQACSNVRDLSALKGKISAQPGVDGRNRECHGKCAEHTIIKVTIGPNSSKHFLIATLDMERFTLR